jgi:hypothetical protein
MLEVVLGVGRIGGHSGHRAQNLELLNVDTDLQTISLEDLMDEESTKSLIGCPVDINHSGKAIATISSVFAEDGILKARSVIDNPHLEAVLSDLKMSGKTLECSPAFTCEIDVDSHNRVVQRNRRYNFVSMLLPGTAGRGGPDVKLQYSEVNELEELNAKIDALVALVQQLLHVEKEEEGEGYAEQCYEKGMKEGVAYANRETLIGKLLGENKHGDMDQMSRLQKVLEEHKIATKDKSPEYCYAALEVLANVPAALPQGKMVYSDPPTESKPSVRKATVSVKI